MITNPESTFVTTNQTSADNAGYDHVKTAQNRPSFNVQTGIQAGGFFDRWFAWAAESSEDWNRWDRNTGVG